MKLFQQTLEKKAVFQLDNKTRSVGVTSFHVKSHLPYADAGPAISGVEVLSIPSCETKEEFIAAINKSQIIHVSLNNKKYVIADCSGYLGVAPMGIFQAVAIDKKITLVKKSNGSYELAQYVQRSNFEKITGNIFCPGGQTQLHDTLFRFTGSTTASKILQANSSLLGSDLVQNNNRVPVQNTRELATTSRATIHDGVATLQNNGLIYFPELALGDSVLFDLINSNNGQFIESPTFCFINKYRIGENQKAFHKCEAGLNIRAGILFEQKQITTIQQIPSDVKELIFERVANNKYEIFAVRQNDSTELCFRTGDVGQARLSLGNNKNEPITTHVPHVRKHVVNSSREGFLTFAFHTPASNGFEILTSPKMEISVAASKLVVNGVTTTIPIAQDTSYQVVVEKTTNLQVEVFNLATQSAVLQTIVAPTYTHVVAVDGIFTWKQGIRLGPWAFGNDVVHVDKAIQIVRAQCEGLPKNILNLGEFDSANGSFQNLGATFLDGTLTVSGVVFERQVYRFSKQVRDILKCFSKEVVGNFRAVQETYDTRISKANIYCEDAAVIGYNESNLVAIVPTDSINIDPVFHQVSGSRLGVYYALVDNQTEMEAHFEKPETQHWSVGIVTQ